MEIISPNPSGVYLSKLLFQERYNTPLEHTPGNPPFANYERNLFMACW